MALSRLMVRKQGNTRFWTRRAQRHRNTHTHRQTHRHTDTHTHSLDTQCHAQAHRDSHVCQMFERFFMHERPVSDHHFKAYAGVPLTNLTHDSRARTQHGFISGMQHLQQYDTRKHSVLEHSAPPARLTRHASWVPRRGAGPGHGQDDHTIQSEC